MTALLPKEWQKGKKAWKTGVIREQNLPALSSQGSHVLLAS